MTAIPSASTRTVDRALALLAEVCAQGSITLSDCARRAGCPPSTALRLLRTLEGTASSPRNADGLFGAGPRLIQLGRAALGRQSLVGDGRAGPAAHRRGDRRVGLPLRSPGPPSTALYIAMVEGTHSVRHTSWVGRAVPLRRPAVGAALRGDVGPARAIVAERDRSSRTSPRSPRRSGGPAGSPARSSLRRPDLPDRRRHHAALRPDRQRRGRRPAHDQLGAPAVRTRAAAHDRQDDRRDDPLRIGDQDVPGRHRRGRRPRAWSAPSGQITVFVGPSGCGKTTSLRMINRMIEPTSGRDLDRRPRHRQASTARAAARHRLRHPARRAVPAPHDRRQRRDRAAAARPGQEAGAGPRAASCSSGSGLTAQLRQALPGAALRRPAAARRRRPGPGRRPAGDADGRAVQRRRPGGARAAAERVPAAAGRAGQDDRVRHPRHRRGHQARRPGRGAAGRRPPRPARDARRAAVATRSTPSSPASSAATAATARSASTVAGDLPLDAEPTVRTRAPRQPRPPRSPRDGWMLVVDEHAMAAGLARHR